MHSESVKLALYDIRDNILFAREIIEGFTSQEFAESRLHVYAATRALEIISEASRRLPDDMRDRHSGLPWRSIRDVGNFYRHQYDNVAAPISGKPSAHIFHHCLLPFWLKSARWKRRPASVCGLS